MVTASSNDTTVVRIARDSAARLELDAVTEGTATVTLTATDPDGLSSASTFRVLVEPDPRAALIALYEATGGPGWGAQKWLTNAPLGEWEGVTTVQRVNGEAVVRLRIIHGGLLKGPLPPEIGDLTSLEALKLGGNELTGSIPLEIGNLVLLEQLTLYSNQLTGPIPLELANLESLRVLLLGDNQLTGPVPPELGTLTHLEQLGIGGNDLTGSIPPEIGDLARLENLSLGHSGLTGPIPPEIGNLSRLEHLSLRYNAFTGPLPAALGELSNLRSLHLDGPGIFGEGEYHPSGLTGTIPPELGNLASLEQLFLRGNALTGPLPPEIGNLTRLIHVQLQGNLLTGRIPPELGNLTRLEWLGLALNDFTPGPIPVEFANLVNLEAFDIDTGHCAPPDPTLQSWLIKRGIGMFPCLDPGVRLLPRALLREDGNGLALPLPDDLISPQTLAVSDDGVVEATVNGEWLVLSPRGRGETVVDVIPSGGGQAAMAKVVVREAVGTFGIDIVMEQPIPVGYAETMTAAADWWSSALNGTEWEDREPNCNLWPAAGVVDDLVIWARSDPNLGVYGAAASACRRWDGPEDEPSNYYPVAGRVTTNALASSSFGNVNLMRHEIGHVLGLTGRFGPATGLMTEDRKYFIGPRAVAVYRNGGGDPDLPGVPITGGCRCHWDVYPLELMNTAGPAADEISLAALADAGYTVDMSKATRWGKPGAVAVGGEVINDTVLEEPNSRLLGRHPH